MNPAIQEQVLINLHLSKEILLNEITILLVKQQLADYNMDVTFYEKKYGKNFLKFNKEFNQNIATFEQEDDWLAWKFAIESQDHWHKLLQQMQA